jgi:hypothetical protein
MRTAARLWLDDLRRDISHDWRGFARDPGFAAAAVVPLALGIGATTAVFCIVNTVLLRPLPYIDIVSLVRIVERLPARNTSTLPGRRRGMRWTNSAPLPTAPPHTVRPGCQRNPPASARTRARWRARYWLEDSCSAFIVSP